MPPAMNKQKIRFEKNLSITRIESPLYNSLERDSLLNCVETVVVLPNQIVMHQVRSS